MSGRVCGHAGAILRVNLTNGEIRTEPTRPYAERFLGGRGIDDWLMYEEIKPWAAPFDPANRLLFGAGVLVGTLAPCSCRHSVEGKSPLTGGVGSANSCGHFSAELKYAGFDNIVIQGRARRPVYLWIRDGEVRLMDATRLWGKTVSETDDLVKSELGEDVQIAAIGPAGENLVRAAGVVANRNRIAARCGLGAVMGSKNLKAVVVRGTGGIEVAHPEQFMKLVDDAWRRVNAAPSNLEKRSWGTTGSIGDYNEPGHLPVRNFQDEYLCADIVRKHTGASYKNDFQIRTTGYTACPIACNRYFKVSAGPYADTICEGFEGNDWLNFVSKFQMDDPAAVLKVHAMCNDYGLDEDNASGAIGWAFECFERGILTRKDTGGLDLRWGDSEAVLEMVRRLAYREGLGDLLAEGAARAAEVVGNGSERYAIHVKGQDSIEALRGSGRSWALGCVVSTRGGAHTRGANLVEFWAGDVPPDVCQRIWGIPAVEHRLSYEHKAALVAYYDRFRGITDSLGLCSYVANNDDTELLGPEDYAGLFTAATGIEMTAGEIMEIGSRIHNVEKAFNTLHMGWGRENDYPPARFMEEPIQSGPMQGELLERKQWDRMLDEYYDLHGWDRHTGWQTRKCLERLGLFSVADDLERVGRLGRSE